MLGVDERADAAELLRLGDHVVDERRLPRRLGPEDLDDPAAREAADAEREVEREASRRDGGYGDVGLVGHLHDRSLAELALDLAQRGAESLLAVQRQPPRATDSTMSYCAPLGRRRE